MEKIARELGRERPLRIDFFPHQVSPLSRSLEQAMDTHVTLQLLCLNQSDLYFIITSENLRWLRKTNSCKNVANSVKRAGNCYIEIWRLANTRDFYISDNLSMFRLILFQDCSFKKLLSDTALKVSFQGNTMVGDSGIKCNRWFFKFNGNECSGPVKIEAAVFNYWPSGNPSLYHHRSF